MKTYCWTPEGMSEFEADTNGCEYVPAEVAREMLEALERIASCTDDDHARQLEMCVNAAANAIAKAKGEE